VRKGPLAFVLALIGVALSASSASAAVQYVEASTSDGSVQSLKVACPAGTHVTGGGEATFNGYKGLRLRGSYPYDGGDPDSLPDDGWKLSYRNIGGVSVEVDAACAAELPHYVAVPFTIAETSRGTKGAGCGYRQVYSGGALGGTLVSVLPKDGSDSDSNPDDSFQAAIDNPRSSPAQATVFAICGTANPDYVTVTGTAPRKTESDELQADCPGGESVLGGGAGIKVDYGKGMINSLFPVGDGFGGYLDNFSKRPKPITAIAVCANLP
jgi:hypothetical protein